MIVPERAGPWETPCDGAKIGVFGFAPPRCLVPDPDNFFQSGIPVWARVNAVLFVG